MSETNELTGAAALMAWLGANKPAAQAVARRFYSMTSFRAYMEVLTGISAYELCGCTHDEACEAYLDALQKRPATISFPSGASLLIDAGRITGRIEPHTEKQRAPLPGFGQRTAFDPHRGMQFIVDKMDINTPSDPWKGNNHALQRFHDADRAAMKL